MYVRLTLLM